MVHMRGRSLSIAVAMLLVGGCGAQKSDEELALEYEGIRITEVELRGDLEPLVTTRFVRPNVSEIANEVGVTQQSITTVPSCTNGACLQLWANYDYTGSTITFTGSGSAYLGNYNRWCTPWSCASWIGAIRSWSAGNISGTYSLPGSCSGSYSAYQSQGTATGCWTSASWISID
jgi:hypothetical protein